MLTCTVGWESLASKRTMWEASGSGSARDDVYPRLHSVAATSARAGAGPTPSGTSKEDGAMPRVGSMAASAKACATPKMELVREYVLPELSLRTTKRMEWFAVA